TTSMQRIYSLMLFHDCLFISYVRADRPVEGACVTFDLRSGKQLHALGGGFLHAVAREGSLLICQDKKANILTLDLANSKRKKLYADREEFWYHKGHFIMSNEDFGFAYSVTYRKDPPSHGCSLQ